MDDKTLQRLTNKVNFTSSCWEWDGALNKEGYGYIKIDGKSMRVHRVVYEQWVGDIPEGMVIDHLCRNRKCVRPEHLEAVSRGENVLRGYSPSATSARKTECYKGHPFSESNTKVDSRGYRVCLSCYTEYHKEYKKKKKR